MPAPLPASLRAWARAPRVRPSRWPPACKLSAREMAALLHDALCTARVIIPGRDPAWIRRDGRMATKTAHRSCLSWPSQAWSMMTGQQLCFFSGTKAVSSPWGVPGRQAECRCTMPMESIRWRSHASGAPAGVSPLARRCLCTQRRYSRCPPKRSGNARHGQPHDEEKGLST